MDSVQNLDSDILKLEEKVKAANLPSDLVEKINTMLSIIKMSLKTGNSQISNFENIQNYINLICLLPFNSETKDTMDINFAREVLSYIVEEYSTLPFCSRWIYKKFGSRGLLALKRIEESNLLHHYPQLIEKGNGKVAQAEHTIIITNKEKIIIT